MSASITLIGNLGKAPETRTTDKGAFIASFSMASNTVRKTNDGRVEKTNWFRVIAFGKQAQTLAKFVDKGTRLCVVGTLSFNPWLDRNGTPQAGADIVLQEFQFLPRARRAENGSDDSGSLGPTSVVSELSDQIAAF